MEIVKWILIVAGGVVVGGGLFGAFGLVRLSRNQPTTEEVQLGITDGRLTPCPQTPNCVSTQAPESDSTHYVQPIPYQGEREAVLDRLVRWIESQDRAEIVEKRDDYLRAVFASRVFRFRDDVEIFIPADDDVVHFRSAARVGSGDLGVNRERYEKARAVVAGE